MPRHFAAVSVNDAAMDAFGVGRDARFAMWDWVGGRYSLWSAVGRALELAIGTENFEAMLAGAHAMDEHFRTAPARINLPAIAGLLAHWNRNAQGCASHAVLPYTQRLARLPAYLQPLEMESLGKRVTLSGAPVAAATGAVIWGEPGSNAQHSFFQLLHQGTTDVSADFLLPLAAAAGPGADELVIANRLAQVQALMAGRESPEPHRTYPGSRPLSLLVFVRLDPATLSAIAYLRAVRPMTVVALYTGPPEGFAAASDGWALAAPRMGSLTQLPEVRRHLVRAVRRRIRDHRTAPDEFISVLV